MKTGDVTIIAAGVNVGKTRLVNPRMYVGGRWVTLERYKRMIDPRNHECYRRIV